MGDTLRQFLELRGVDPIHFGIECRTSLPPDEQDLDALPQTVQESMERLLRYWTVVVGSEAEEGLVLLRGENFLKVRSLRGGLDLPTSVNLYRILFLRLRPFALSEPGQSQNVRGRDEMCARLGEIGRPFQIVLETVCGQKGDLMLVFTD